MSFSDYIPLRPPINDMVNSIVGNVSNNFTTQLQQLNTNVNLINQTLFSLSGDILTLTSQVNSMQTQLTNLQNQINNINTANIPPYYPIQGYNFYQMNGNLQARLNLYQLPLINDGPNVLMFNFYNITGTPGEYCIGVWPQSIPFPQYYFVQLGNDILSSVSKQGGQYALLLVPETTAFELFFQAVVPPPLAKTDKSDKLDKVVKEFKQLPTPKPTFTNDAISFLVYYQ